MPASRLDKSKAGSMDLLWKFCRENLGIEFSRSTGSVFLQSTVLYPGEVINGR